MSFLPRAKDERASLMSDVRPRGAPEMRGLPVVNLKPSFVRRYRYALGGGVIALALTSFLVTDMFSQASSVSFYPTSCLGNWDDVQKAQGKRDAALKAYQDGLTIHTKLAAQDPRNSDWQRDLSISHNKIGGVLEAQGKRSVMASGYGFVPATGFKSLGALCAA